MASLSLWATGAIGCHIQPHQCWVAAHVVLSGEPLEVGPAGVVGEVVPGSPAVVDNAAGEAAVADRRVGAVVVA